MTASNIFLRSRAEVYNLDFQEYAVFNDEAFPTFRRTIQLPSSGWVYLSLVSSWLTPSAHSCIDVCLDTRLNSDVQRRTYIFVFCS